MESEEEVEDKQTFIQFAVRKGLILAGIHIVVSVLLYVFFPSKLAGFSYVAFIILLNIGFSIYTGIEWRNQNGGFMEYGEAFKLSLLILIFNGLLSSFTFPIIHSSIDSSYSEVYAQAQVDTSIYWAQRFGAPETTLDKMRDKMDLAELKKRYSPLGILTGFGIAILFYVLGSLVIALFTRKSEPVDI